MFLFFRKGVNIHTRRDSVKQEMFAGINVHKFCILRYWGARCGFQEQSAYLSLIIVFVSLQDVVSTEPKSVITVHVK